MSSEKFYTIIGPPGTGKTRTIAQAVADHTCSSLISGGHCGQYPAAVVSLTRTAAAEAAGRTGLPRSAVGTLHSFAFRFLGRPTLAVDRAMLADWNQHHPMSALSSGEDHGDRDINDDVTRGYESTTDGDLMMERYLLRRAQCEPRKKWGAALLAFAKRWEQWKTDVNALDFADLIDRAAEYDMPSPGEHLYVDEAQDFSEAELRLLRRMARTCESVTLVGDPDQCLYRWRGSKPQMFADERIPMMNRRVLAQSWRVPRAVHAAAVRVVERISHRLPVMYHPTEEPGCVEWSPQVTYTCPEAMLDMIEREQTAGRSVMIAGSCEYHLARIARMLRGHSIPFSNPWRRRAGHWNPLQSSRGMSARERLLALLRPDIDTWGDIDATCWTYSDVEAWTAPLRVSGILTRGARAKIEMMAERSPHEMVPRAVLNEWFEPESGSGSSGIGLGLWSECGSDRRVLIDDVISLMDDEDEDGDTNQAQRAETRRRVIMNWVNACRHERRGPAEYAARVLLTRGAEALRREPQCYVGTIHSYKGAEADVVILLPDVSPIAYRQWRAGERDDLLRQFYVGLTRARHTVYVCGAGSGCAIPVERMINE